MPVPTMNHNSAFQQYNHTERVSTSSRPVQPIAVLPAQTTQARIPPPAQQSNSRSPPPPPPPRIRSTPDRDYNTLHINATLYEATDLLNNLIHQTNQIHHLIRTIHHQLNVDLPFRHVHNLPEVYNTRNQSSRP